MTVFDQAKYSSLETVAELGRETFLCIDPASKKLYVRKIVDPSYLEYYERIAALDSPFLTRILGIIPEKSGVTVIREYVSGDTISDLLSSGRLFDEKQTIRIAIMICDGLTALHRCSLVHRDINANNILITTDGNVKIIDYGIVRLFDKSKSTDTVILGTPGYAAPEQFGFTQSDSRTDIYALGVLMNVMMTGRLPSEDTARGGISRIIEKCVMIDPQNRYENIEKLKSALLKAAPREVRDGKGFSYLPGFGSNNAFILTLSTVLYLFMLISSIGMFIGLKRPVEYFYSFICWCLIIFAPYVCFGNFMSVRERFPLTAGMNPKGRIAFFCVLGILSLFIGFSLYGTFFP